MNWLTQFFLNPAYLLPGAALVSLPIVIHLLSRLRYRRVQFAAMEFLLQSDEMNRRRLLIEQLLLLLLRILAIVLIVLLIARLLLDPSRLMLQGATTHHMILLDDSLSMRAQAGRETVFEDAVALLERLLTEQRGATSRMRVTVALMSRPERPLVTNQPPDNMLLQELIPRLRNLECSWQSVVTESAVRTAGGMLSSDGGVVSHLHIVTDFRRVDWNDRPELTAVLKELGDSDISISLIPATRATSENVVVSDVTADTFTAAVGVPWRMEVTLRNTGASPTGEMQADIVVDGETLPARVVVPPIPAGEETTVVRDVTFAAAGLREVQFRLEQDVLPEDNRRTVLVSAEERRRVLIIDDDGRQADASYISAALSSLPEITGINCEVRTSQTLSEVNIFDYDCVYLLNVRSLPPDRLQTLATYVSTGGGIVWFPGDQADFEFYNRELRRPDTALFPVTLGPMKTVSAAAGVAGFSAADGGGAQGGRDDLLPAVRFESHPVFGLFSAPESPFREMVRVSAWHTVAGEEDSSGESDDALADAPADTEILARLSNGAPVVFEHTFGAGRVITFLISAGRRTGNWPLAPASASYVVTHLRLHAYLQAEPAGIMYMNPGQVLRLEWPETQFADAVELSVPTAGGVSGAEQDSVAAFRRLTAVTVGLSENAESGSGDLLPTPAQPGGTPGAGMLELAVRDLEYPGVAVLRRRALGGGDGSRSVQRREPANLHLVVNVPLTESDLGSADASVFESDSELSHVDIIDADAVSALAAADSGREVRWFLLGALILTLVLEQLLSLRMSYHPEASA